LRCCHGGKATSEYCVSEGCDQPWIICSEGRQCNGHGTCREAHAKKGCAYSSNLHDFYQKIENVINRRKDSKFFEEEVYTPLLKMFSHLQSLLGDLQIDFDNLLKEKEKKMTEVEVFAKIMENWRQTKSIKGTGGDIRELSKAINTNQLFVNQAEHLADIKNVKKRVNKLYTEIIALIKKTREK
jgi:hypothetical protein